MRGPFEMRLNVNLGIEGPAPIRHLPWNERVALMKAVEKRSESPKWVSTIGIAWWIGAYLLAAWIGQVAPAAALLLLVAFTWASWRTAKSIVRKAHRRALSALLIERGIRPMVCCQCDYDLKGSTASACPECGEPLAPAR